MMRLLFALLILCNCLTANGDVRPHSKKKLKPKQNASIGFSNYLSSTNMSDLPKAKSDQVAFEEQKRAPASEEPAPSPSPAPAAAAAPAPSPAPSSVDPATTPQSTPTSPQ